MSRALSRKISDRRVHLGSRVFAADFFAWCADSGTQLDARSNILGNCNFSWRQQAKALIEHRLSLAQRTVPEGLPSVRKHFRDNAALPIHTTEGSLTSNERSK